MHVTSARQAWGSQSHQVPVSILLRRAINLCRLPRSGRDRGSRNGTKIHPPFWTVISIFSKPVKHCCFRLRRGDSWQSPVKNRRWLSVLGNGRGKKTDRMTLPDPISYIGILHFSKVHFISLHFYKRAVKQYVSSLTKRNLKGIFLTKKGENSIQHLSCSESTSPSTGSVHHSSKSGPAKLLPLELHSASQHQAAIALNCACEHMCFILIYFLYLLARCVLW